MLRVLTALLLRMLDHLRAIIVYVMIEICSLSNLTYIISAERESVKFCRGIKSRQEEISTLRSFVFGCNLSDELFNG